MSDLYVRHVGAVFYSKIGATAQEAFTRYYRDINTASEKAFSILMREGEVGDFVVFHLRINGLQVGVMRKSARGKVVAEWDSPGDRVLAGTELIKALIGPQRLPKSYVKDFIPKKRKK